MNKNYSFLRKYVGVNDLKGTYFNHVPKSDILHVEEKMGFPFPTELKLFYETIGEGSLECGEKYPEMYIDTGGNIILPPLAAAEFYKPLNFDGFNNEEGVSIAASDGIHFMTYGAYQTLEPGSLPFFEIFDSTRFLVMKPHSNTPNTVWSDTGIKIEESFEKFIWRLYYENPAYYDDIIEAHYAQIDS